MKVAAYFNEEEAAFVKAQGPGYLRRLVQREMVGEEDEKNRREGFTRTTMRGVPLPTGGEDLPPMACPKCGMRVLRDAVTCTNFTCDWRR